MTWRFVLLLLALAAVCVSTGIAWRWIPLDNPADVVRVSLAWFTAGGVLFVLAHLIGDR